MKFRIKKIIDIEIDIPGPFAELVRDFHAAYLYDTNISLSAFKNSAYQALRGYLPPEQECHVNQILEELMRR